MGNDVTLDSPEKMTPAQLLGRLTVGQIVSICSVFIAVFTGGMGVGRYLPANIPVQGAVPCYEAPNYPIGRWLVSGFDNSQEHARLAQYATFTSGSTAVGITDEDKKSISLKISPDLSHLTGGAQVDLTASDEGNPPYTTTFHGTLSRTGCMIDGTWSDNRNHGGPQTMVWFEPKDSFYIKR